MELVSEDWLCRRGHQDVFYLERGKRLLAATDVNHQRNC